MAPIVRTYLGNDTMQGHSIILSLAGRDLNVSEYISGQWHHDRCGRRLKAFIFLNDVEIDGRPTVVARGSHNTLYYRWDQCV